jgi:hypothetical protein
MTALLVFSFLSIGRARKPGHAPVAEGVESGHADAVVSR